MRKLLLAILVCVGFCFSSCESSSGDILKGKWKNVVYNSSAVEEYEMYYIFDGKGHYKFIFDSYEKRITRGTYELDGNIVHTYYTKTNEEGVPSIVEENLELDTSVYPPTLTGYAHSTSGDFTMALIFVKQK